MKHAKLLRLIYCPSFLLVSPWNIKACSPQTLDISFKCSCHSEIAIVISCNFALSVPSLFGVTCRSWKGNTNRLQGSILQGGESSSSEPIKHLTIYLTSRGGVVWQSCVTTTLNCNLESGIVKMSAKYTATLATEGRWHCVGILKDLVDLWAQLWLALKCAT